MSLGRYLDSSHQLVAPSSEDVGYLESLSSCIALQKDRVYKATSVTQLDLSYGHLSPSVARMAQLHKIFVRDDMNSFPFENTTSSGLSMGRSSGFGFPDADLPLPVVAHLLRDSNPNPNPSMDPYADLYSSQLPFSLNPSVLDGTSVAQEMSAHLDWNRVQGRKRMQQQQASSVAVAQMRKRSRVDVNKDDILYQQIVQKLLQGQDHDQMQYHNPQLQELMQQNRLRSLQSVPQLRGVHSQQQVPRQVSAVHPLDGGVCSRRLMQYMYHLRQRPADNNIAYWRKFVTEYYAPCAKQRWCLSTYDNIGQHACGVFFHAAMEGWHCDICGAKSGKGFEAIYEILPRLNKMKYESGVIDELLFLDLPHERTFHSGIMMLEYGRVIQESVYDQFRVVHEGRLRVTFNHVLKILSWEFCARHHEELLPRKLIAPQVNQLVQAANKYQSTINDNAADKLSSEDLQSKCNMFLTAGRQFSRNLELLLVNDLGFPKRFLRCLQIGEVINSMKDLMTFSSENNVGPIESLKNYSREYAKTEIQMKPEEQTNRQGSGQGLPTEGNNAKVMHPDSTSNVNDNSLMTHGGLLKGTETASLALNSNYQKLQRQSSASHNAGAVNLKPPPIISSKQPSPVLGSQYASRGLFPSSPEHGWSNSESSYSSKNPKKQTVSKVLQGMASNSKAGGQKANSRVKEEVPAQVIGSASDAMTARSRGTTRVASRQGPGNTKSTGAANVLGSVSGRTNVVNAASNSRSSGVRGSGTSIKREPDLPEKFGLPVIKREAGGAEEMAEDHTGIGVWKNWKP